MSFTTSQDLAVGALGLQFIVLLGNPALGRDVFFASTLLLLTLLFVFPYLAQLELLPGILTTLASRDSLKDVYICACIFCAVCGALAVAKTRRLLTEWKSSCFLAFALALSLSVYFYLPLASMTNPPVNWGYPRTVEGFIHDLTRGQYEHIQPTDSLFRFVEQLKVYSSAAFKQMGLHYLLAALVPLWFLRRMHKRDRRWFLGLTALFLCLSAFMLAMLNPPPDRAAQSMLRGYFCASHLVLAL